MYTVLMKRLFTEGITDEMLYYDETRFNPPVCFETKDYKLNLAFGSR